MKHLIPLLLFLTLTISSQDAISIGIYQDARLGLLGDNKGNDAGTLDIKLDVSLQGKQFRWYYFEMRTQVEYADLYGGKYVSWLVSGGWVLNQLILSKIEVAAYLTIGAIHRWKGAYGTYGITADLSYQVATFIKVSFLYQVIKRSDLVALWNDQQPMKPNFYIGIKYNIFKL